MPGEGIIGTALASGAAIAFVYLAARIASRCKLFQDAPDCDPYLNRILGEIRSGSSKGAAGEEAASEQSHPTFTYDNTRHGSHM